jgi:predicted cobalt transporter CbtA
MSKTQEQSLFKGTLRGLAERVESQRPNNLMRQEGAPAPRVKIKVKKRQLNAWLPEDQLSRFERMVIDHKRSTRKRGAMLVELMDLWDAHHGKAQV